MCIFCWVSEEFVRQSAKDLTNDESKIVEVLSKLFGEPDSAEVKKEKLDNADLISMLADPKKCIAKANELVVNLDNKDDAPTFGNEVFSDLIVFAFAAGYLDENLPMSNEPFKTIMSSCIAAYLLGIRDGREAYRFDMWKADHGGGLKFGED